MKVKIAVLAAAIAFALFMILPLRGIIKSVKLKNHGVITEATVTQRTTQRKGFAMITVTFNTSDGTEVTAKAQKKYFVAEGDKVKVWYDAENPQSIDFGDMMGYNIRGVIIVAFISLLCFYLFFRITLKDSVKKKLISTGRKIAAEFVSVDRNEKYRMGDKNPWVIRCRWVDSNNKEHIFSSKDYTIDPSTYMNGVSHIDVFIDPADPGKYYMDTSFMPKGNITFG